TSRWACARATRSSRAGSRKRSRAGATRSRTSWRTSACRWSPPAMAPPRTTSRVERGTEVVMTTRSHLVCAVLALAACKADAHKEADKAAPAADVAVADRTLQGNPFAKSAIAVIDGRKIYLKNGCSGCHGMGGGGGMGKPLIDDEWK